MIHGFFVGENPNFEAIVTVPRLNSPSRRVDFAIDTGAEISIVQQRDAGALGFSVDPNATVPQERHIGVGGRTNFVRETAIVSVTCADGTRRLYSVVFRVSVDSGESSRLPSLLGMDFISHFQLTVSYRESRVELEPLFEAGG